MLLPIAVAILSFNLVSVIAPLLVILNLIAVVVLFAFGKIKGIDIYLCLFGLSLSLVLQTTALGVDVVGSDIHMELYYSQRALKMGWDITYPDASNSSIVVGILIPMIARGMSTSVVMVMKFVVPILFAITPIVLFASFRKLFSEQISFFATIFFIIIPVYSMEIAQIAKSMVAELFLAIMFYAIVSSWKWYWKLPIIVFALAMQILSHYTVGILGICFLLCLCGWSLVMRWGEHRTHVLVLIVSLVIGIGVFFVYHSYAANGSAWRSVRDIAIPYFPKTVVADITDKAVVRIGSNPDIPIVEYPIGRKDVQIILKDISTSERPPMVRAGLGIDFFETTWDGKVFRVIQYITELMIILGGIVVLWNWRKYPVEYIGFMFGGGVLLLLCILVPSIASIINMSRYYHFALFFIAPLFIVGCMEIGNKIWK
jgi:uncharacterized membrane protein